MNAEHHLMRTRRLTNFGKWLSLRESFAVGLSPLISSEPLPYFFLERYSLSYQREWAAFVDAVRRRTPPPVTGADGCAPLVIGLAARRSLREHRPVRVTEIEEA
jgi:myo-inositol 2-dehydrogenase/D-chiro-inositol 1-dehydrogenase